MTRELLELITDISDFTTLFHVILRRETSRVVQYTQSESIRLCDLTNRLDKSQCENEGGFEMTWFQFNVDTSHRKSIYATLREKLQVG